MKQREIILQKMQEHEGTWFLPQDFMRNADCFVGYEASARMSELAKEFPQNIESVREGRQIKRRWISNNANSEKGIV